MRWSIPKLGSSIYALFSPSHPHTASLADDIIRMEDIRDSMLALLAGGGDHAEHVIRRIRYASDVQSLWFLRGDLMAVLAGRHGETAAWEKIAVVSAMFDDLLPQGLRSRPSPLGGSVRH